MLLQQMITPSSDPKKSGGLFSACLTLQVALLDMLRESTHPSNGFHSLFNPSGSQTNKPKEYTQWALCSHQSSKVSYLLSSRLPGQKAGHQFTMSLIMQGTHSKLSSPTEASFTRLEERDRNLSIPIRGGGRDS